MAVNAPRSSTLDATRVCTSCQAGARGSSHTGCQHNRHNARHMDAMAVQERCPATMTPGRSFRSLHVLSSLLAAAAAASRCRCAPGALGIGQRDWQREACMSRPDGPCCCRQVAVTQAACSWRGADDVPSSTRSRQWHTQQRSRSDTRPDWQLQGGCHLRRSKSGGLLFKAGAVPGLHHAVHSLKPESGSTVRPVPFQRHRSRPSYHV